MPGIVIIGAQWGDEGKGKITDLLAERADAVVRFQGGNNAGHTIVQGSETWKLHLVPSGILHPGKLCVIGNGVVIDPKILTDELDDLRRRQVETGALRISANAHLIMPYHMLLDHAGEIKLGRLQIGTTRRGIGPCYADKAARLGIRVQDLLDEKILKKKIVAALEPKRLSLREFQRDPRLDLQAMTEEYLTYGHRLKQYIADTSRLVLERLDAGDQVLFEGAQGTLLDIDHGTYPFVTSSNPIAGAATIGAGVGPKDIDEVWGVAKAYSTRVGAGPFPTELEDPLGEELRARGAEVGTTTGRPRRVGWLDLVALRYAARLNSLTALAITKLDVLSGQPNLMVATSYRGPEGLEIDHFPYHQTVLHHSVGHYAELPGWDEDISDCRSEAELPQAARDYLNYISEFVNVPVTLVSVGPRRDQVIWMKAGEGMAGFGANVSARQARR
ncbi:MAG: adenylosuccinate synthase [Solirubrobacteraceae bacterium]